MISDEKIKQNLLLAYKISELYLKSGSTVSELNRTTGVSLATIKRSLHMIENRIDDYLRLLPELGTEEELKKIQDAINTEIALKKTQSKWSVDVDLSSFTEEIENIKTLYSVNNPLVTEDARKMVTDLKFNGSSYRKISEATGISLAGLHGIITKETGMKK